MYLLGCFWYRGGLLINRLPRWKRLRKYSLLEKRHKYRRMRIPKRGKSHFRNSSVSVFPSNNRENLRLSGTISTTQTLHVSTKFLKFGPPINSTSYRHRVTEVLEHDERRVSTSFELISRYDNWITSRAASNNEKRGEDRMEAEPGIERQAACDEPPRPFVTPPRRPAVTDLFLRSETRMIPLRHSHIPRWRG